MPAVYRARTPRVPKAFVCRYGTDHVARGILDKWSGRLDPAGKGKPGAAVLPARQAGKQAGQSGSRSVDHEAGFARGLGIR